MNFESTLVIVVGIVEKPPVFFKKKELLHGRCNLVCRDYYGRRTYITIWAVGKHADEMNVVCRVGNIVAVKGSFFNRRFKTFNGVTTSILAQSLDSCGWQAPKKTQAEKGFAILDELDPSHIVGEDYADGLKWGESKGDSK